MKFQKGHKYIGPKEGTFKGKKHTEESKRKMSKSLIGRKPPKTAFKKGHVPWIKGKKGMIKHTSQQIEKMKKNNGRHWLGKKRNITPGWREKMVAGIKRAWDKKGRKKYKRSFHVRDSRYLKWRSDVFKRDNWTCQTCGARGYVEAHHIKPWVKFINLRYDVTNGVTLCKECHNLTR